MENTRYIISYVYCLSLNLLFAHDTQHYLPLIILTLSRYHNNRHYLFYLIVLEFTLIQILKENIKD
ncbi:hypothetical protein GLOIN_2v1583818 [Rhizophagus irregularis DAOM 181602=DAOM 197198]|uniref:Uncharacterized protein n=1 Tax=Rhizophagus irregularis (strain DAOM 181602 / DAOM 197198 / MUCL 43194) TaxID=747089 RepID=A0A2P4Q7M0_RHIID|nr:hypothetical protein GLOIN_2v1583818 [Rhizophagus irregularis DAOM 181602=DAOM 197198]POG73634.1 hypothetical protein GLOIN_2v1583818 [Rhizophagus irregularis DAOM 181602=DAOM 197198]|eukprot:XP_025180500.1 hypothetical protein GLOIN_2v1583818 [Rhizophagus irregularis DAOM 181602=DAOM 197198]